MSVSTTDETARAPITGSRFIARSAHRPPIGGLVAAAAWLASALVTTLWPDRPGSDWAYTSDLAFGFGSFAIVLAIAAFAGIDSSGRRAEKACTMAAGARRLFHGLGDHDGEFGLLPTPFFPPPQAILEVVVEDWARLGEGVLASMRLLAGGYFAGAAAGFVTGVAIGWSRVAGYWIHPVLRLIGPLPATAWLPLAFFVFPSSLSASTFLIALATGFPVTVLTWSGVADVNSAYYDIARTLGASRGSWYSGSPFRRQCHTCSSDYSWAWAIRSRFLSSPRCWA